MVDGSSTGSPSTSRSGFPPDPEPADLHTEHSRNAHICEHGSAGDVYILEN